MLSKHQKIHFSNGKLQRRVSVLAPFIVFARARLVSPAQASLPRSWPTPELRIRATPPIVLRRTTQALDLIRKLALNSSDRAWRDLLQTFEAARDEWSAMEAVVKLELLLEAEGLLIEKETAYASRSDQGRSVGYIF